MSAGDEQKLKELYEFGPFRVDPEKEVLLRAGQPVPLQPKTFQILLVLMRHSREIVTKEDLMKAVWPDTFVEEANLSRNVFMLRKALGENPPEQRYIITVPGRGYRLAESVRLVPEQHVSIIAANRSKVQVELVKKRAWARAAVAAIVALAVAVGVWRSFRSRSTILSERDTVVLADFTNTTGDVVFDETLRQGLSIELEQSPFLSLTSEQRIHHTLQLMGKSANAPLTPELARGVCERTGSTAVLEGSIAPLGSQYVLGLSAMNCRTGKVLAEEQGQAARKEDVLKVLSQIASTFRSRVGESLATVQQHDTPLAEATTPSLEALEAYSKAWRVHFTNGAVAALPLFKRATEIDPRFAMAHAALGRIYAELDESDLSAKSTSRAWQLRFGTTDRERFFITTGYETLVMGNEEQARETLEEWAQTYPRDAMPHAFLSGYANKARGQFEKAAAEAGRAIELDPDFAIAYYGLGVNQAYMGRSAEAENTLQRAAGRGLEIDEYIMLAYDIAFLKADSEGMKRIAARARERSNGENWIASREASVLAYSGQLELARNLSRRAVDQAQQAGQKERASLWGAGAAVREGLFGNVAEARNRAMAALKISQDREAKYGGAFALALVGDSSQAKALADEMQKRFPEDTAVRFSYLPSVRARVALNHGDAAKAIDLLQPAIPYELGAPRSSVHALFGALYPVYVRGEAYLAESRGPEAVAEFQKIVDHRGVVVSDSIGALAHLQLGRAYTLLGDKTKAESAYQDFLTLWKNADPDIPILKQAKAEYARLQ